MVLQDVIVLPAPAEIRTKGKRSTTGRKLLIYFIPGNPGLVEYYREYLELLYKILRDEHNNRDEVIVYAESHDGFELQPGSRPANTQHVGPYSLEEEVESVKIKLQRRVRKIVGTDKQPLDVVLIGHSVGAYMLLETVDWWQNTPPEHMYTNIIGGINLFPTIVDILKSKKGQAEGLAMTRIPYIPIICASLAWIASLLFCGKAAKAVHPGPKGWEVTAAIGQRWHMTRQVVHLARDEMLKIKDNKWHPNKIWGKPEHPDSSSVITAVATHPHIARSKLFFYWGAHDYWVADETLDELLAMAKDDLKHETRHQPTMLVDTRGIPHTFSLNSEHAEYVAKQTANWINGLLAERRKDSAN